MHIYPSSLQARLRRQWRGGMILLLALPLLTLLAGCEQQTTQHPSPACPSSAQNVTWPAPATQVISYNPPSTAPAPVTLQVSQTLEVDLYGPWTWQLRSLDSPSILTVGTPAGYLDALGQSCVWRFTAQQAGAEQLRFFGNGMCQGTAASCVGAFFNLGITVTAGA